MLLTFTKQKDNKYKINITGPKGTIPDFIKKIKTNTYNVDNNLIPEDIIKKFFLEYYHSSIPLVYLKDHIDDLNIIFIDNQKRSIIDHEIITDILNDKLLQLSPKSIPYKENTSIFFQRTYSDKHKNDFLNQTGFALDSNLVHSLKSLEYVFNFRLTPLLYECIADTRIKDIINNWFELEQENTLCDFLLVVPHDYGEKEPIKSLQIITKYGNNIPKLLEDNFLLNPEISYHREIWNYICEKNKITYKNKQDFMGNKVKEDNIILYPNFINDIQFELYSSYNKLLAKNPHVEQFNSFNPDVNLYIITNSTMGYSTYYNRPTRTLFYTKKEDDSLIGGVVFLPDGDREISDRGIYIKPSERGKGYGTSLYIDLENHLGAIQTNNKPIAFSEDGYRTRLSAYKKMFLHNKKELSY